MADKFLISNIIAPNTPATENLTTSEKGHERFTKAAVIVTATDLNAADATISLEARIGGGQYWIAIQNPGPVTLTATAGDKNYALELPTFLYSQLRVKYTKGSVTLGKIQANVIFKD